MRSDLLSRLFAVLRVEHHAGTDPETGFAARQAIREDALGFATLRPQGASVLLISFDGPLPQGFVRGLRSLLKPGDKPYRLSAREIALLLPSMRLRQALGLAEHIRIAAELEMAPPAGLSIGLATTDACGFDLEGLVASADRAAREARLRGGNRIVVAEPTDVAFAPRQASSDP